MSGLILTTAGAAAIEAAYQAGTVVKITLAAFGDGGGKPITPNPDATALVNKFGDAQFTGGASTEGMISGQTVIEARKYPGRVLREVGLFSAGGVLVAYGDYPDTVLPADGAPVMKEIIINFVMTLTHAESVVIEVDPNVSALTISEADKRYLRQSLNLSDVSNTTEARDHLQVYSKVEADGRYVTRQDGTATGLKITDQFTLNEQVRVYRENQSLFFEVKRDDGTQPAYFSMSANESRLRCGQFLADSDIRVGISGARIYRDGSDLYFQVGSNFFGFKNNGQASSNSLKVEADLLVGNVVRQYIDNGAFVIKSGTNYYYFRANGDFSSPQIFEGTTRVYSPNNPPPAAPKNTAGDGWWRCGDTGVMNQQLVINTSDGQDVRRATFPVPFPNFIKNALISWSNTGTQNNYPPRITSWDKSGLNYVADGSGSVSIVAYGG